MQFQACRYLTHTIPIPFHSLTHRRLSLSNGCSHIDGVLYSVSSPYFFSFLQSETRSMPRIWAARVLLPPDSCSTH